MPRMLLLVVAVSESMALVAHAPALRTMAQSRAPAIVANPQMSLGGGSSRFGSFGGFNIRSSIPKLPQFGKGMGNIGRGADGGDGGSGTGDAMSSSGDDDKEDNPFMGAWKRYNELLDEKPLLMKALTSFVGFALGDILAQIFIQKNDPFDFKRLARMASFGFLVHGTSSHWFYGMLDGKIPGTSAKVVFTKVFIDQVLWNPCFGVMFFSYVALLEAKGLQYVVDKVRNELLTQVTGSWKVWPVAHAINFRFIPSSQRVLYINTIQIGYNCFLSLIANREAA
jgi:protein Mpv17